ncbi:18521_t:CDS:1, partial [Funneliformis geosporum]
MSQKYKQVVKRPKSKAKVPKYTQTSYSIELKEEVVNYAKKHKRNNVAAYFDINKNMIGHWVRANEEWIELSKNSKSI